MFFKSKGLYSFEGRMARSGEIFLSVVVLDLGSLQMNLGLNPSSGILLPLSIPSFFYSSVSSSIKWVGERLMK